MLLTKKRWESSCVSKFSDTGRIGSATVAVWRSKDRDHKLHKPCKCVVLILAYASPGSGTEAKYCSSIRLVYNRYLKGGDHMLLVLIAHPEASSMG